MVPEQYAALIDDCVAEVHRTVGGPRRYRPPVNPMRAVVPGGEIRPGGAIRRRLRRELDIPYPTGSQRRTSGWVKLAVAVAAAGLVVLAGAWFTRPAAHPAAPVLAPAPAATRSAGAEAAYEVRAGESCHQIERSLMSSYQNPNGSFYSQAQADAVIAQAGGACPP